MRASGGIGPSYDIELGYLLIIDVGASEVRGRPERGMCGPYGGSKMAICLETSVASNQNTPSRGVLIGS